MCVMGIHTLLVIDSTLPVVFRDIVNHVGLGITIDLVRAVDHDCVCGNSWYVPSVPLWHVETDATDISPDLITLG